jgi:hypothetical protein
MEGMDLAINVVAYASNTRTLQNISLIAVVHSPKDPLHTSFLVALVDSTTPGLLVVTRVPVAGPTVERPVHSCGGLLSPAVEDSLWGCFAHPQGAQWICWSVRTSDKQRRRLWMCPHMRA